MKNTFFWRFLVLIMLPLFATAQTPKEQVFYYSFDGNYNETLRPLDPSFTLAPTGTPSFVTGKYGSAVSLSGSNQYLDLNVTGLVNSGLTQYTFCAWVYDEASAVPASGSFRDQIVIAQKDNAGTGRILLSGRVENNSGTVRYIWENFFGAQHHLSSDNSFKRGVWQHIAIVCDNNQITYYIDGVKDLTLSATIEACSGGFRIGAHKNGNESFWTGKIDELYLFKGLLSGKDICAVRDNTFLSFQDDDPEELENDLAFYYPFDGSFNDSSINNYLLTPSASSPTFTTGKYGQALSLNGNAQYLDLNSTGIINTGSAQFTVCVWVKDEATGLPSQVQDDYLYRDEVILAQKDDNGTGRIILYGRLDNQGEAGATRYFFQNILGNRFNQATDGSLERNTWKHVAVCCDAIAQTVTFYIDGVKDAVVSALPFEACTGGFRIGGHKTGKDYWQGEIDELYLFRNILSEKDILKVRNNTCFEAPSTLVVKSTDKKKISQTDYTTGAYQDIIFRSTDTYTGQLAIDGGTLNVNGVVKLEKTFAAGKWYAIGFPFDIASVRCDRPGFDGRDLETFKPSVPIGEEDRGDYWLKTYNGAGFDDYTEGATSILKGGYVMRVPADLDGATLTFTSIPNVQLGNSNVFAYNSEAYKLTCNPSVANTKITNDAPDYFYAFETIAENNFGLLGGSDEYDLKPFESVVIANLSGGPSLVLLDIEQLTSLPKLDLTEGKVLVTEYYNLQGMKIGQAQQGQIYIVKSVYESGKTKVIKQIK